MEAKRLEPREGSEEEGMYCGDFAEGESAIMRNCGMREGASSRGAGMGTPRMSERFRLTGSSETSLVEEEEVRPIKHTSVPGTNGGEHRSFIIPLR